MSHTTTFVVINEFDADAMFNHDLGEQDSGYESDASSDAGSDWLLDETMLLDAEDCLCADREQQPPSIETVTISNAESSLGALDGDQDVLHGFIGTDTLRAAIPPIKEDVMPTLEPLISLDLNQQKKPRQDFENIAQRQVREYQHNPYQHRVIPCRTTSRFPELSLPKSGSSSYDKLPICPCQLSALVRPSSISTCSNASTAPIASAPLQQEMPISIPAVKPATEQRPMCCYFKQKGHCKMGAACWYSHEGDLYTPCHYGASCKAGHATLALMSDTQYAAPSFDQSAAALASMSGLTIRVGSRPSMLRYF
jgi:hypothetical protein